MSSKLKLLLETLDEAVLANENTHPVFGSMSAGNLLASWAAHDLMHLGQIARTMTARAANVAKPYTIDYAT